MLQRTEIRALDDKEFRESLTLVWEVFQEFKAPDYTEEGVREFYNSIHDEEFISKLSAYGAFDGDKLVGVIATGCEGSHLSLFFVDRRYQGRGIGKRLFHTVLGKCEADSMTVNSSPYAVAIYRRFGFKATDREQSLRGLRYVPMEYRK